MRKFTKISLAISGLLILIGTIAAVISIAFGGKELLRNAIANNEFSFGFVNWPDWNWNYHDGYWDDAGERIYNDGYDDDNDQYWENDGHQVYSGNFSGIEIANAEQVHDLEIEIGAAALYIKESEDDVFRLDADIKGKVKCYVKDGKLILKNSRRRHYVNQNEIIYLYVPKNTTFGKTDIGLGAGEIIAGQLKSREVDVEIGAGQFLCSNIEAEEMDADIGVGQLEIENGTIVKGDFTIGVGSMNYDGEIKGDLEVDCSIGSAEFYLRDREENHNYDVSADLGTVNIGDRSYSSLSNDTWIDNNANSTYSLKSSMGSISINFQ